MRATVTPHHTSHIADTNCFVFSQVVGIYDGHRVDVDSGNVLIERAHITKLFKEFPQIDRNQNPQLEFHGTHAVKLGRQSVSCFRWVTIALLTSCRAVIVARYRLLAPLPPLLGFNSGHWTHGIGQQWHFSGV